MITNYYPKFSPKILWHQALNRLLIPFRAPNVQLSAIVSNHDEARPTRHLLEVAADSFRLGLDIDLSSVSEREKTDIKWSSVFPGEHYRLLAALMMHLKPRIVVEIGTYLGLATLAIRKFLPAEGVVHTFDVIRWNDFRDTCFVESDFADGGIVQHLDDLTDFTQVEKHRSLLEQADFIFVDALKDGIQEKRFLENFEKIQLKKDCLVMFDDIRVWNMVAIWRNITRPKLDVTSMGHWSGSGLIHWNG